MKAGVVTLWIVVFGAILIGCYFTATRKLAESHYNAGIQNLRSGDYLRAVRRFSASIGLNPRSGDAYFARGMAEQFLGNSIAAASDYHRALELKPGNIAFKAISEHLTPPQ